MRHGRSGAETFCAYPTDIISLSHQVDRKDIEPYSLYKSEAWNQAEQLLERAAIEAGPPDLYFQGGIAGFASYETMRSRKRTSNDFPSAFFGAYPHFVHIDHHRRAAEEIILKSALPTPKEWPLLLAEAKRLSEEQDVSFRLLKPFEPLTSKDRYSFDFKRIKNYIASGDCYQVNYAQAFKAMCEGSSASAMQRLLAITDPAYAAWLSLPEGDVLSLSPELFMTVKNRKITTRPIKGTAPRLPNPQADIRQADALRSSTKNRAENLMIVDLLRHDIGQHAKTGSVRVEKLFEIESLPQVHHMVSTIQAELKEGSSIIDLLRDCFPGGSITGAPKKRAMEIIAELEPTPRSVYCGSIGFINSNGDGEFNIAIRTLLRVGNEIYAWAGGGIVADSDCESEYQECFDKMGALMRALEQMGNETTAQSK
ncbi:MAG: aminodeoxychorismate synthase component I [Moraxellaceae bacterium]